MHRYASAVECKLILRVNPKSSTLLMGDITASDVAQHRVGILKNLCYDCSVNLHKNNMGILCANDVISSGVLLRNV